MGNIFTILFVNPITNLLVLFYKLLFLAHIPYALGFSVIVLTIFIRIILYPFVSTQLKAADKMRRVAPHLAAIREKHKSDKKMQQSEMMKLYQEHGINPASGCLPTLVQLPIIWSLYSVLTHASGAVSLDAINKINAVLYIPFLKIEKMWDTSFFGLSLADSPSKLFSTHVLIILVPVATGVFQFILSKMMMPDDDEKNKVIVKKDNSQPDFQTAFQKQSLYLFPAMIGFFSFQMAIGLSLYWNTFTIFGILQQYILIGPGGTKSWIDKLRKNAIVK